MARYDIYKVPHKAQRRALYLLVIAVGRLNPGDGAGAAMLASRIHQIIAHVRDHSFSEDKYFRPLYEPYGGLAALDEGHHKVEALMAQVEKALADGALLRVEHAFYRLFNQFVAAYVEHLEEEERGQERVLWPNYTDQQLVDAQGAFVVARNPMSSLSDLAVILPSLNIDEICEFLSTVRRDVPAEPYGTMLAVAGKVLEPQVWSAVESRLKGW